MSVPSRRASTKHSGVESRQRKGRRSNEATRRARVSRNEPNFNLSVGVFGSPLGASLYCICPTPRGAFEQARCQFAAAPPGKARRGDRGRVKDHRRSQGGQTRAFHDCRIEGKEAAWGIADQDIAFSQKQHLDQCIVAAQRGVAPTMQLAAAPGSRKILLRHTTPGMDSQMARCTSMLSVQSSTTESLTK